MSVWGKGPFEDDTSLDFRADLIDSLIATIDASLKGKIRTTLTLYTVHSVCEVLYLILHKFGGTLGRPTVDQWVLLTKDLISYARERGTLESLDEELIAALDRCYLRLHEVSTPG